MLIAAAEGVFSGKVVLRYPRKTASSSQKDCPPNRGNSTLPQSEKIVSCGSSLGIRYDRPTSHLPSQFQAQSFLDSTNSSIHENASRIDGEARAWSGAGFE